MKKTLLFLAMALLPAMVFAQGQVQFNNTTSQKVTTNSTAAPPPGQVASITGNTGPSFTFGLYIAPAGTVDTSLFTLSGTTPGLGSFGAGTFNGNPSGGNFTINGNNGEAIAFQIRAWQTSGGATYELASGPNVYRGQSAIGSVSPATGTTQPPALYGAGAGQLNAGFVLTPNTVPEPSSIALGLLGLGAVAHKRKDSKPNKKNT